jgi:hypothetical protein
MNSLNGELLYIEHIWQGQKKKNPLAAIDRSMESSFLLFYILVLKQVGLVTYCLNLGSSLTGRLTLNTVNYCERSYCEIFNINWGNLIHQTISTSNSAKPTDP